MDKVCGFIDELCILTLFYCCGGWIIARQYDKEMAKFASPTPEFDKMQEECFGRKMHNPAFDDFFRGY